MYLFMHAHMCANMHIIINNAFTCMYISRQHVYASQIVVTKFKTPDNFLSLLSAQNYGPTTQLIMSNVSS